MFKCFSGYDPSKRITNKVDSFVVIKRVKQMQSNLLSNCLSKLLYGVVNIIFNSFNEKTIAVRVINIHKISSFLKIYATSLISMNHNDKGVNL